MSERTNKSLIDTIRRLDLAESPSADPAPIVARGRRGLRRRRILAAAGAAGLVAAVAVTTATITTSTPPPVVGTTATPTPPAAGDYLDPMPGVPGGEAALARIPVAEAQRRCDLRYPGAGTLKADLPVAAFRGGSSTLYAGDSPLGTATGTDRQECEIPGDSKPTAAGSALLSADPIPADSAGRLRNCSVLLWHNLRSWRILTADEEPGVQARLLLGSPSGRYVANCVLSPPPTGLDAKSGVDSGGVSEATPPPDGLPTPNIPGYPLSVAFTTGNDCAGLPGIQCKGWLRSESGRAGKNVVRIVLTSTTGATHEIKVVDGRYVLVWVDPAGSTLGGVRAYDAQGKVVYQR